MKTHELKTDPGPFQDVYRGRKKAEIRKDDRGFSVGDVLALRETLYSAQDMAEGKPLEYSGRICFAKITHITAGYGLKRNYSALSFELLGTRQ